MVSDYISIAVPFTIQKFLGSNQTQPILFFFNFLCLHIETAGFQRAVTLLHQIVFFSMSFLDL